MLLDNDHMGRSYEI